MILNILLVDISPDIILLSFLTLSGIISLIHPATRPASRTAVSITMYFLIKATDLIEYGNRITSGITTATSAISLSHIIIPIIPDITALQEITAGWKEQYIFEKGIKETIRKGISETNEKN